MHLDARNEPRPTDIDERLMAFRRRTAGPSRSSANLQKQPPPSPTPNLADFSRKLKISSSSTPRISPAAPKQSHQKLFNPDSDPIPLRRVSEPESVPDSSVTLYPPRPTVDRGQRQLFDHRKDDPVKFSAHFRPSHTRPSPTHKSSGDYVSASSTSSYAPSVASSITLSSTTDSSTSSALFDGQSKPHEQSSNALSTQLKLLYREITGLESRIKQEDTQDDSDELLESRILIKGRESETNEIDKDRWKRRVADHKKLADIIHELLVISLAPSVPASLRQIPTKYNIIVRLWTFAFHRLLESLRRASFSSPVALEHLQDFIYYAYTFYTNLLENETTLKDFKTGWLEALGDLARYRMAVAAIITGGVGTSTTVKLTEKAIMDAAISMGTDLAQSTDSILPLTTAAAAVNAETSTDIEAPKARIDDSLSPSVGVAAARLLEVEPEKELWRSIAREWYAAGLSEQPGTGKLHHHLGLLSREVEGEELRAIYHFVKSMTALHPFSTARESVLPLWSAPAQARRFLPDALVSDLFVLLHGMLFTNIQLDDFQSVLSRFIERLELDGAEERQWIMMAVVNIGAILEYGRPGGILRRASGIAARDCESTNGQAAMKVVTKKSTNAMDIDQDQHDDNEVKHSPRQSAALSDFRHEDLPAPFLLALQLTFSMLSHVLHQPLLKSSAFMQTDVNPYLTVILTFLLTMIKHPMALQILERAVPWEDLAAFLNTIPKKYVPNKQGVIPCSANTAERGKWITNGCSPPLPEDWCLRGMEWERRRVFERGYWKSDSITSELDVLAKGDHFETTDGKIEDDESVYGEQILGDGQHKRVMSQVERRWVRVLRCGGCIAEIVDGFSWSNDSKSWKVQGNLLEKMGWWRELDQAAKQEEEERKRGRRWVDESMDVDDDEMVESEESEDDERDSEEVKALKARRRYLRSLLQPVQLDYDTPIASTHRPRQAEGKLSRPPLCVVPGYTILVIDTNILLSSLSLFASLIESLRWTIVVPLPVIMELDGLGLNTSALGEAAQNAIAYISSHIRTHGLSLKVQTSKGNYLTTLTIRTEQVDFSNQSADWERCMDDLILKAAIWQDEHWVDRSQLLGRKNEDNPSNVAKVVLLSLDRNLRLKARSRQLLAASEKDLAAILANGK